MTSTNDPRQIPDYEEIMHVIDLYALGWKGQPGKFKEAFEEDAWIFFTDSAGQLQKYLLADCFNGWASTNWEIVPCIIAAHQNGDIASVVMKFDNKSNPAASFVDVHNLLKVNGIWKITNKTATHISRAGMEAAK